MTEVTVALLFLRLGYHSFCEQIVQARDSSTMSVTP